MTFEEWRNTPSDGGDSDLVYADWKVEREKLIEALEAIRDQTGEPETKDIARAVLEEVQHKEG